MGVRFQCPRGHQLHVKADLAGRRGICPKCGVKFIVPSFSGGRVAEENGANDPPPLKGREQPSTGDPKSPERRAVAPREATRGGIPGASAPPPSSEEADGAPSVAIPTIPAMPAAAPIPATNPTPAPTHTPKPVSAGPVSPAPPQPVSAPDAVAWYVRPAGGGQFGPAATEAFRGWVEDGRVAADSWVWRTGWTDWRPGAEAIAALADMIEPPPATPPPAPPATDVQIAVAREPAPAADAAGPLPRHEATTAEARRAEMRRRRKRNNVIAIALGVATLIIAVVMAIVLSR